MTQSALFPRLAATRASMPSEELLIDNFAGGGGASTGIELAMGRAVDIAINHDAEALEMHAANHPHTRHIREDVWSVDPAEVCQGRPVGLAWFSPDCKHFSRAKGATPVSKKIRSLAWVAVKWAKAVRPRVIMLENVREFRDWGPLTKDNRPCPERKGRTFLRFVTMLRNLGYQVEWRDMDAAEYGCDWLNLEAAPTHRRRLFMIARCDGLPIRWPAPTNGKAAGKPFRTAAECIDWSLPCRSIFGRKRPLAEKTLRRIALGLKKYVLENPKPFIVNVQHGSPHNGADQFRGQPLDKHGYGVVTPYLARCAHGETCKNGGKARWGKGEHSVEEALPTLTASKDFALIAPVLVGTGGPGYAGKPRPVDVPVGTVMQQNHTAVVAAQLIEVANSNWASGHRPVDAPAHTITAQPKGGSMALCSAFLTKFYGTATGSDPRQPLPTVTANGQHIGEVRAFLIKYFGNIGTLGQEVSEPLHTLTAKPRFGLVTIEGQEYEIADIGLRMLTPRELARAQFGPELAEHLILPRTIAAAVAKIGNSVVPLVAAALVRANMFQEAQEAMA